jgi:hypothetical protein
MKIEKFDKSSFAGTEAEQSTNADNEHVSQPIAKPNVVRSFLSAQELRIGNIVTDEFYNSFNTLITVENINKEGINLFIDDDGNYSELASQWIAPSYPFTRLRGIPLTDKILKECGFEYIKEVGGYCDKNHVIYKFRSGCWGFNIFCANDRDCTISIKHFHQLQNLYFMVTGYELKVSLK